jgi:hypothetical protein
LEQKVRFVILYFREITNTSVRLTYMNMHKTCVLRELIIILGIFSIYNSGAIVR